MSSACSKNPYKHHKSLFKSHHQSHSLNFTTLIFTSFHRLKSEFTIIFQTFIFGAVISVVPARSDVSSVLRFATIQVIPDVAVLFCACAVLLRNAFNQAGEVLGSWCDAPIVKGDALCIVGGRLSQMVNGAIGNDRWRLQINAI
jgi:hypothetical protein